MAALTCDACGSTSLTMTDDGQFSVCDYCGTKHTIERVRAKVQEIKGVVEITKGEAEKERLIKNAETFIELDKIDEAEEIYAQLVKEYPNDWIGWAGNAYIQLLHFPCSFSSSDIYEFIGCTPNIPSGPFHGIPNPYNRMFYEFVKTFTSDYKYSYKQFEYFCNIANKLANDDFAHYIKEKWEQHDDSHNRFVADLENMLNNGVPCFDKISLFFADDAFVPTKLRKIITQLEENAAKVSAVFAKSKNKYDNIYPLGKIDFRFDYDGTKRVDKIAFLSFSQAVLLGHFWQGEYGNSATATTITFNNPYTEKELIDILSKPTDWEIEEPKLKEANQLIHSMRYNKSVLQKLLNKYTDSDLSRHENTKLYQNYSYEIKKISKDCISYEITYYSTMPYDDKPKKGYTSPRFHSWVKLDDIIMMLKWLNENKCCSCGGEFKGIFKKVCSRCGEPKDY